MLWPAAVLGGVAGALALWPLGGVPGVLLGALLDRRLAVLDIFDLQERLAGRDELQVDALLLLHAMGWMLADSEANAAVEQRRWLVLCAEARIAGLPEALARQAWLHGAQHARLPQLVRAVHGRPLRRDYLVRLALRLLWLGDSPEQERTRLEVVASRLQMPDGRLAALEQELLGRGRVQSPGNQPWLEALEVLGMPLDSSDSELERAYRRLLARWHPDRHHAAGEDRVALATERTRQIRQAWEVIRDHRDRNVLTGQNQPL